MFIQRVAFIGLLCVGAAIAYNCDVPGHDHSAAASQQSFASSSTNFVGGIQGVNSVSHNGQLSGTGVPQLGHVTHNINHIHNGAGTVGTGGNTYTQESYSTGTFKNELQENTPYWWMGNPSPFKTDGAPGCNPEGCKAGGQNVGYNTNTYEHKMDLSKNPFINGQYSSNTNKHTETVALSGNTHFAGGSENSVHINNNHKEINHLGNNPYLTGVVITNPIQTQSYNTQTQQNTITKTDINNNQNLQTELGYNSTLNLNSNANINTQQHNTLNHHIIHPPIPQHHGFGVINTHGLHHHHHIHNGTHHQEGHNTSNLNTHLTTSSAVSDANLQKKIQMYGFLFNNNNNNNNENSKTTQTIQNTTTHVVFGESLGQNTLNRNNLYTVYGLNNNNNINNGQSIIEQYESSYQSAGSTNDFTGYPFINLAQNHVGSASSISGSASTFDQAQINTNNPLFNGIPQPSNPGSSNFAASSGFISTTGTGKTQYTSSSSGFVGQNQFATQGTDYGNVNVDRGYLPPESKTTTCSGPNTVCALKNICPTGVITDQQVAAARLTINGNNQNQFCNPDSEVCCKVQARPPPTPAPPVITTQRPQPPPTPQTTPCGQKNTKCVSPDLCINGIISPRAPTSVLNPNGPVTDKCYAPEVCCRIPEISPDSNKIVPNVKPPTKEYLPQTERPVQTTRRPAVQPIPTDSNLSPVTRPNKKPFKPAEYLPPVEDIRGSPSNERPDVLAPVKKPQPRPNEPNLSTAPANELPTIVRPNSIEPAPLPPAACAAALKCTPVEFCSMTGMISKTAVSISPEQEIFRVPMTDCRNLEQGFIGKCCRDPDYVDPWPVGQLGQYNPQLLGFDDGSYKSAGRGKYTPTGPVQYGTCQPVYRDRRSQPRGAGPIDTGFMEIPWQAMVLLDTNRSLLCGGSIISDDAVITSASCVHKYKPTEIMIKGGEWRLGVDEEPKPFQIIRVKEVSIEPRFKAGKNDRDVAILHLEDRLRFDTHIQPICIEDPEWAAEEPDEECITTGWGREVLKVHVQNALMHVINVTSLPEKECIGNLSRNGFNKNASFCGKPISDACMTDDGSGLACNIGNDYYFLRGIYVGETSCGESPTQYGTYSKIDINWVAAAFKEPGLTNYNPEDPYGTQALGSSNAGVKRNFRRQVQPRRVFPRRY